jgi:recombination protein RecR
MLIPDVIQRLIDAFSRLPGIGPKTASRLTFYLLRDKSDLTAELSDVLSQLHQSTTYCQQCFNITAVGNTLCQVCSHPQRNSELVCVVEEPLDVIALERTGGYPGLYHVLYGVISPIEGTGPEDIKLMELVQRVQNGGIEEIIIATNPSTEGDITAMQIKEELKNYPVKITRLARGLPVGGDLEYADQGTLLRALDGRNQIN